ncbi:MAG: DUF4124 domain-containing protein [Burkholderiaceae bacterium]|uniref:DUF4124 domain-containing protein n=1 Tax=Paucibacter sp. KCTC 42545 TaxID=1768242 RepID=UPI000733BA8E|nr:DUF4124 domain-containing protein [Paucibacter sp. KCTC 42545]ALT77720.1 hypothetical protein AT984_11540 [Paucibacter sp. KCTC 42545]MBY0233446.1 DUF4124 domain-containing protein [Burkholderiaceae bacterium]
MPKITAIARCAALFALALSLATPAAAQWKWRDPAGKMQFSDLPPPNGTPEADILQRPASSKRSVVTVVPYGQAASAAALPPAKAASGPSKEELAQQAKNKQQEKETLAKQKDEERRQAEQRRANCKSAQDNLSLLQSGIRVTRSNERGEPVVLDDQQRELEMQRARTAANSECR